MVVPTFRLVGALSAKTALLLLLGASCLAGSCLEAPTPPSNPGAAAEAAARPVLVFSPPEAWSVQAQTMAIFLGQWKLPNDGIANVSYMGPQNSEAFVTSNLDRWLNQFEVAGSTPQQAYQTENVDGYYPERRLTLKGTLVSTTQIGGGDPRPDWMLVGAVLTTPAGPAYVKILGPAVDLEPQLDAIWALIGTMRLE